VHIFDASTGKLLAAPLDGVEPFGAQTGLAYTPDGRFLIVGHEKSITKAVHLIEMIERIERRQCQVELTLKWQALNDRSGIRADVLERLSWPTQAFSGDRRRTSQGDPASARYETRLVGPELGIHLSALRPG